MLAYYNIFGAIFSNFISDFLNANPDALVSSEYFAMFILALCLLPTVFEREIKDLEYMAHLLFYATAIFFLSLISLVITQGISSNPDPQPLDHF